MSTSIKKLSGLSIFAILLLPMIWNFETATVAVATGTISLAFPGESSFKLQLLICSPFITSVIFSVVSGRLANHISKRTIALIGLIIYALSGMIPGFINNIDLMIALRFITGIGVGLILPIPNQLIIEHYEGKQREKMFGYVTASFYFACVVVTIVVGLLIGYGWRVSFYAFGFIYIVLIVAIIGLPKTPVIKREESMSNKEKIKLPKFVYGMFAANFIMWIIYGGFALTFSMFVVLEELAPVTTIGIVMSIPGIASIVAGIFFPFLKKTLGRCYIFISLIGFACGYVFYVFAHGVGALIIGSLLMGIGTGLLQPFIINLTSLHVNEKQKDAAMGVVSSGMHLGSFGGAFLISFIMSFSPDNPYRFTYTVLAIVLAAAGIFFLFTAFLKKQKGDN